jgi:outer membrane lipoprotein-sorting protein
MKLTGPVSIMQNSLKTVLKTGGTMMAAAFLVLGSAQGGFAADDAELGAEQPATNAITGTGSAWKAQVTPNENAGKSAVIPEDQKVLLEKINAYMQKFNDLEGRFIQTNPDNVVQKGKFYVLRPGKMRFDYASPSRMRIVSDGKYLTIEDHDLKTANTYPLESTPFRMLLMANVKLERDARILSLSSSDSSAAITIADKTGQSAGQIQLFFTMPEMVLKEWIITDAQGLHTRIEVSNLAFEKKLASKLFKPSKIGLANVFGDR